MFVVDDETKLTFEDLNQFYVKSTERKKKIK